MIPAVVLAAGLSTRMGRAKALLPIGDETFIERIAHSFLAAGVPDVVIVLGHEGDAIAAELLRRDVRARIVHNPNYRSGQFSSVLAGLHAVDRPGVEAMLLTLVDVPLVAPATIRAVVDRFHTSSAPIVRPVRGSEHGHPVLIARSRFADLRGADPAQGAKPVVRRHATAAGDVTVEDAGAFLDIDTPAEYARVLTLVNEPDA